MKGPYRTKLLDSGAFGVLLRAALTSVLDDQCDMIVQQVGDVFVFIKRGEGGGASAGS